MSGFDGSQSEMPEHRMLDDDAIDVALAGRARDHGDVALSAFVSAVRSAVEAVPTPSAAMAAVLASGFSTEKGDLPATAASNVDGPAEQVSGLSKWRNIKMKIQGFLAGLGIAGKVALGIGVAAAATTGASATGVLPFSLPGSGHGHHGSSSGSIVATTTSTTRPQRFGAPVAPSGAPSKPKPPSAGSGVAPTTVVASVDPTPAPTTVAPTPTTVTTPTTTYAPPPTYPPTPTTFTSPTTEVTPTTVAPAPYPITLSCHVTGATQVTCDWTSANTGVEKYALWRWTTGGNGSDYAPVYESPDAVTFVDNSAVAGTPYTYRVFVTLANGTAGPVSNRVQVSCCS